MSRVVVEFLPKVCASLIAGYLLTAQPWKSQAPVTASPASQPGEASGTPTAQLIAAAHTAPLEAPATRANPATGDAGAAPSELSERPAPVAAARRVVKERQFRAHAKASTPVSSAANPQPATAAPAVRVAAASAASPSIAAAPADTSWSDKVLNTGDSALQAAKWGSARVLDVPVTAFQYGREAVGKATATVTSVLPSFGR